MPVAWDDDNPTDAPRLRRNVVAVLRRIVAEAASREPPTVALAQRWHRDVYAGIELPVAYFAGEVRNSDPQFPELFGYEVRVGTHIGVPSRDVPAALVAFEQSLKSAIDAVDSELIAERPIDAAALQLYVTLAAAVHGEWIRIHPFANGNGRTARLWTHWLAARYDLPPLVRVRPRPNDRLYRDAAAASMTGDHRPMRAWLLSQLPQ